MRFAKTRWVCAAAVLGAAAALLPAVAGSETIPAVEARNVGIYTHYWEPEAVSVETGATVEISNPTEVPHGVHWLTGPAAPACEGVVAGTTEVDSATKWSGTCRFATAGVYTYDCTVHGAAMKGTITVGPQGVTTTTTTTPGLTPTSTSTGTTPPPGTGTGAQSPPSSGASLLDGPALSALKLFAGVHGAAVHGTIDLAGAARLEVTVTIRRGLLGLHRGPAKVRVGRLARVSASSGRMSFAVALDAAARRALHAHPHLRATVELVLTPVHGAGTVTVTRAVTLHG